jgi:hypothetical protein
MEVWFILGQGNMGQVTFAKVINVSHASVGIGTDAPVDLFMYTLLLEIII